MNHLERIQPILGEARDRLRNELAAYGCGVVLLDGVSTDEHTSRLINSPIAHEPARVSAKTPRSLDEPLFITEEGE